MSQLGRALGCLLAVSISARLYWLFTAPFHWDEFHFLVVLYDAKRGALDTPLQTFYTHLFSWLPGLGSGAVPPERFELLLGRSTMFLCAIATLGVLYALARRLYSPQIALACCVLYSGLSHVLEHGASFRYDPPLSLGFVVSWWLLTVSRAQVAPWLAGVVVALMVLVSMKAVLVLPTLLLLALCWRAQLAGRPAGRQCGLRDLGAFAVGFAITLPLLGALHAVPILLEHPLDLSARVASVGGGFLAGALPFAPGAPLVASVAENPVAWCVLGVGFLLMLRAMLFGDAQSTDRAWMLAPGVLLLLVPFFYRNSFSYLMPLVLLAPVLFAGLALEFLENRARGAWVISISCAAALLTGSADIVRQHRQWGAIAENQDQLLRSVHRMFPGGVDYIDRCSMIATFKQRGLFMSSWVMARYHREGVNQLRQIYEETPSSMLLINGEALDIRGSYERTVPADRPEEGGRHSIRPPLFESDWRFLREHFVPYSGAVFLAGRRLAGGALSGVLPIAIAGRYRLVQGEALFLEGERWEPGQVRALTVGRYFVFAEGVVGGDSLERIVRLEPAGESLTAPQGPFFWR